MRITYIINNQFTGDGVGNTIVELCGLLQSLDMDWQVLHEDRVEPPSEFRERFTRVTLAQLRERRGPSHVQSAIAHWQRSDVILFDYSVHYNLFHAIRLPMGGKKVLIYHGVTPPQFWPTGEGRQSLELGFENLKLVRHADFAVAASGYTADELQSYGLDKEDLAIIPYCIHLDRFCVQGKDPRLLRLWNLQGHFILLYAGRMAPNKRIDVLVRGLAAARQSGLPIKLLLVGNNGPSYLAEVKRVEKLAAELGVGEHVVFTGLVSEEILPRCFALADIYVSASEHEGFGIPLVEAMASGKPVVAARAASVPGVLQENGRLFEPGDADGMASAVVDLLGSAHAPPEAPRYPPRLCFVVPRYGVGFAGGAETLCRHWAQTCHEAGWQVQVIATTTDCMIEWKNHFPEGDDVVDGVPVRRFAIDTTTWSEYFRLHHLLHTDPKHVSYEAQQRWIEHGIARPPLFEWLADHRADFDFFIFLPYLFNTTLLGVPAVKDRAIIIPCLHDEGHAYTDVVRETLDSARAIFFNSTEERDFALSQLGVANPNCFTLGVGMDTQARGDADAFRAKFGITDPFVLYCGRLEEGKNVPLLLEYFGRYRKRCSEPIKLVLLGSGRASSAADVLALGYVSEADKRNAMAAALGLINPSVNESLSMVVLESWVQERPVCIHRHCAVTRGHIERCGGGWCFENFAEFSTALDTLLTHPDIGARNGQAGRRYVMSNYHWPVLLEKFRQRLDLLRSMSAYEEAALRSLARSRAFGYPAYRKRWTEFFEKVRLRTYASRAL